MNVVDGAPAAPAAPQPGPCPEAPALGAAPPALCAGTRLATPDGPVPVERLAPGDTLLAADGARLMVRWIGERTIRADLLAATDHPAWLPVTIPAGALGDGRPVRALHVSPAQQTEPASQRLAGMPDAPLVHYCAVETDRPGLLLAEGVAVPSYRDRGDRNAFANVATWCPAAPEPEPEPEPELAEPPPVAAEPPPVAAEADPRPSPQTQQGEASTDDPGLHLLHDGQPIWPAESDGETYRFEIPARSRELHLASRSVVPFELDPAQGDRRRLGVGLRSVRFRTPTLEIEIGPEEDSLGEGFHAREPGLRWTGGRALLPPRFYRWIADPCEVEVRILKTSLRYPTAGAAPAVSAATGRKQALVIDACTPTPDRDAGSNVALWHMRLLQELGWDVTFVPQDNFTAIPGYTAALHESGIRTVESPEFSSIEPFLRARGRDFALAYVHRFQVAEACLPSLRAHAPQAAILFNPADLHHLRLARFAALGGGEADLVAAEDAKRRELAVIAACDATILCSDVELGIVSEALPSARLALLPWVIEAGEAPPPPHRGRRDVMFLGGFAHGPNADAVRWFVESVMPILGRLRPELRFHVYGSAIPPEVEALAGERVVIGGHVADLRAVFDRHLAAVAPLRYGAGFKGKVAEALAAGVPNIGTSIAFEGTGMVAGEHMLVADTAPSLAMAIARTRSRPGIVGAPLVRGLRLRGPGVLAGARPGYPGRNDRRCARRPRRLGRLTGFHVFLPFPDSVLTRPAMLTGP